MRILNQLNKFLKRRRNRISKHVSIGVGTNINHGCVLRGYKQAPILIGKWCAIGECFRVITRNHNYKRLCMQGVFSELHDLPEPMKYAAVVIGNGVWIGENVTILPGVNIGDGAVIGACSVVTKDVAPYTVAAGNPARTIKNRFSNPVNYDWWNWEEDKIKKYKDLFLKDWD